MIGFVGGIRENNPNPRILSESSEYRIGGIRIAPYSDYRCAGEDSNLHGLSATSPSSWPVYQFQHPRMFPIRRQNVLNLSIFPVESRNVVSIIHFLDKTQG